MNPSQNYTDGSTLGITGLSFTEAQELFELTSVGNPANHSMVFKTQTGYVLMKPIRHYHTASLAFNASAAASIII